jgi:hypothetical protein
MYSRKIPAQVDLRRMIYRRSLEGSLKQGNKILNGNHADLPDVVFGIGLAGNLSHFGALLCHFDSTFDACNPLLVDFESFGDLLDLKKHFHILFYGRSSINL